MRTPVGTILLVVTGLLPALRSGESLACEVGVTAAEVQAQVAHSTLPTSDSDGDASLRRRLSNLLPDRVVIDAGARWLDDGRTERMLTQDLDAVGSVIEQEQRDLGRNDADRWYEVGARVEWRLTGVAWDDQRQQRARLDRQAEQDRAELMQDAADAWWRWQQALNECREEGGAEACLLEERWRAHVDSLTDGWLSERCGIAWQQEAPTGATGSANAR